jgi:hypothetical protein
MVGWVTVVFDDAATEVVGWRCLFKDGRSAGTLRGMSGFRDSR